MTRPLASNLNFVAGQTVPNLVVAAVGRGGQISIHNFAGTTHVVVDVVAFAKTPGVHALRPARVLDTRPGGATSDHTYAGTGALGPGETRTLPVANRGGLPSSGASAVILNVTATDPGEHGYLTVWPAGQAKLFVRTESSVPGSTTVYPAGGLPPTVPSTSNSGGVDGNLVVVAPGLGGQVSLSSSEASAVVDVHVVGYLDVTSTYEPVPFGPARLLDTRAEHGAALVPGATRTVTALAPTGARYALVNIVAADPSGAGTITAWSGPAAPALPTIG